MPRPNWSFSPTVLVAPLDWGLGHATRCIPIIKELLHQNFTIIIAASGPRLTVLQAEFPKLFFLPLPEYKIKYSAGRWSTIIKLLVQVPKIIRAIHAEHKWLQEVVRQYALDAVISDNRYGLYHKSIHTVFITHQLTIKTPFGFWTEGILRKINYIRINKFNECWIPDFEGPKNLAGDLSHPQLLPAVPTNYIGVLSRFTPPDLPDNLHLLVIISGPEPGRTELETLLLKQLESFKRPVVFVRGLPDATTLPTVNPNIVIQNHLPLQQMEEALQKAAFVISRCGYSTVMDMITLQKKSILIPTPGQTEQEYLAAYLMEKKWALCFTQQEFRLAAALQLASSFAYATFETGSSGLHIVINNLYKTLNEKKLMQPDF